MSGSKRPGKPHIMLGGDPEGLCGRGVPTVTADGDVATSRICKASHWMRQRLEQRGRFRQIQSTARVLRSAQIKIDPAIFDIDDTPPELGRFNCAGRYAFPPTELDRAHRLMITMRRPK